MSTISGSIFVNPGDSITARVIDSPWPYAVSIDHGQASIHLDHDAAVRLRDALSVAIFDTALRADIARRATRRTDAR